jgi:hypothetical protein
MGILQPGTMFKVTSPTKDSTFGVGTLGCISHVEGSDRTFPNVIYYNVVIIRRGKTGKARLELSQISTPVFTPECENSEYILPKTDCKGFVFVEYRHDLIGKSILKFEDQLFLAWAYAYTKYLSRLHSLTTKVQIWPHNEDHILNTIDRLQTKFVDDSQTTIETYTTTQFRKKAVVETRHFEAMLAGCGIDYLCRTMRIKKGAINTIVVHDKDIKLKDIKTAKHNLELAKNKLMKLENIAKARKMPTDL